jgi:hypothetical protein
LAFSNATRRNNVLNAVNTRIQGKNRWGVEQVTAVDFRPRLGQNGLLLELRFTLKADADDLADRMAQLFPANPPIAGSWMEAHDCTHDQGENICGSLVRQTW